MVVLDESKENFVLDVPLVEEVTAKLREEERKKAGRYLAVAVILLIVCLGLYQAISYGSPQMSAFISAAMIMFLFLLWLLYASRRRSRQLKINELTADKQVSQVLENLNNIKSLHSSSGPNDNYVYASSEEEAEKHPLRREQKIKNEIMQKSNQNIEQSEYHNGSFQRDTVSNHETSRKSSRSSDVFIRTYSIA